MALFWPDECFRPFRPKPTAPFEPSREDRNDEPPKQDPPKRLSDLPYALRRPPAKLRLHCHSDLDSESIRLYGRQVHERFQHDAAARRESPGHVRTDTPRLSVFERKTTIVPGDDRSPGSTTAKPDRRLVKPDLSTVFRDETRDGERREEERKVLNEVLAFRCRRKGKRDKADVRLKNKRQDDPREANHEK